MIRTATISILVALASAGAALSCGFHNYVPQPTLVDVLLGSDHVVLARPDPENPFRYKAVEAVEGGLEAVRLPHLVDSVSRRVLAGSPEAVVLFARDGTYGPWQQLATIDAASRPVLERIVARLPEWELGGDADRAQTFADLLDHPNPAIARLALRELDLVDYSILKSLEISFDRKRFLEPLNMIMEYDLKPIRLLLMGLSGEAGFEAMLADGMARNAGRTSPMLGAYATAYLELMGAPAAREVGQAYLVDTAAPLESRESLVEALAIHSQSGSAEMQGAVRDVVAEALGEDPGLAPAVARQFGIRSDWSQHEALLKVLRGGGMRMPTDVLLVSQYVSLATSPVVTPQN